MKSGSFVSTDSSGLTGQRIILVLAIAVVSGFVGELYGNIFYFDPLENDYYMGFRCGFSIGLISAAIEIFYVRSYRRSWIRRVAFLPGLIVRILVLTVIVRLCLVANNYLMLYLQGKPLVLDLDFSTELRDTLFSMAIVIFFVTLSQLSSVIGLKHFTNLVVGRYFKPVNEERIFMFIDVVGSTEMAQSLGDIGFHQFLADFFYVVDGPIVRSGGEVVSYVGDGIIVTWPLNEKKQRNDRCLVALQTILMRVEAAQAQFQSDYGRGVTFRAAIHGGPVVVGECGNSRRQVTFLGDVVNITSRIEAALKVEGQEFFASETICRRFTPPKGIHIEPYGNIVVKGARESVALNTLHFAQAKKTLPQANS